MNSQRCTLRNIAEKCQVSTAIVSTVLNGREGRMACSENTRKKILSAAKELNYVPNALARSMREKRVPLVGVFLRQNPHDSNTLSSSNIRMLSASASALNKHGYETIFVPFSDAQNQYERMNSLISMGIIGGIITCILKEDSQQICQLLKNSGLPYLILGNPPSKDVCCLYRRDAVSSSKYLELAAERGLKNCFSVELSFQKEEELIFRAMPYPNNFIWDAPICPLEEVREHQEDSLFVIMGMGLYQKMLARNWSCKNFVIVEYSADKAKVPDDFDAVFVARTGVAPQNIEDVFCPWLLSGKKPEIFHHVLEAEEDNFEFRFHRLQP